jgi:hypothetical protein
MDRQAMLKDLNHVKKESSKLDPSIAEQLGAIGDKLASISDDDFKETERFAFEKEAKLLNEGNRVVCVNAVAPLFKGRIYIVSDNSMPGFVAVKEEDGSDVGIFEVNRFLLDWKAY